MNNTESKNINDSELISQLNDDSEFNSSILEIIKDLEQEEVDNTNTPNYQDKVAHPPMHP